MVYHGSVVLLSSIVAVGRVVCSLQLQLADALSRSIPRVHHSNVGRSTFSSNGADRGRHSGGCPSEAYCGSVMSDL